jgi:ADP-ribose pyrophosphatase YjhB (NUDIX family)
VAGAAHRVLVRQTLRHLLLLALGRLGLLVHGPILTHVALDAWKHCPVCGAGVEPADGKVECAACGYVHYAHSSVTASALVVDGAGRLLLARRAIAPFRGRWDLPGGFVEEGEHPLDALRRELREETGLEVEPGRFVGVWMDRYGDDGDGVHTLNLYWTARAEGEPIAADDVAELAWFDPDDMPPGGELAFHMTSVLDAWRQQHP